MNLSPDSKATFRGGTTGHVARVIYDPRTADVTHLVVQVGHLDGLRMVPIQNVDYGDDSGAHLNITEREFETCDRFQEVEFVPLDDATDPLVSDPYLGVGDPFDLGWPFLRPDSPIAVEHERVPPGEIAFRRGAPVDATDGRLGHVGAFVVDWGSGHMTHLVLQHGHLWGSRRIAIPLSAIRRVATNLVQLSLSKAEVELLPDVPAS